MIDFWLDLIWRARRVRRAIECQNYTRLGFYAINPFIQIHNAIQIAAKATDSDEGQTSGTPRLLIINYHARARACASNELDDQTVPPNCLDGRARKRKTTGAAFSALINCTAASQFLTLA